MKKRIVLSSLFIVSLLPMLMNQYGGMKDVQEITGLINLLNPIGITSVLLFIAGVWMPFKNLKINSIIGFLGTIGIVVSEIYKFFTWHVMNITGEISLQSSLRLAFPAFYLGLIVSVMMVFVYCLVVLKENSFSGGRMI